MFYNGVLLRVTLPDERTTGSLVRTSLQCGGQFACLHRFTKPQPTHLSISVADSLVIGFNLAAVIINSAVDNYWPDVSGEIHPICFYITYCFL